MRTMRRIMNAVASAAVCALALTGCSREVAEKEYGAVKFGFSAAPTATRTQFENDATPSGRVSEHVYWKNGDAVTVCSDVAMNVSGTSHSAVYTVSSSSDNQTEAPASSADGLRWQNDGTHKFFAVYGSGAGITLEKVTGSMPASQSLTWNGEKTIGKAPMEYGFMVSTKESGKTDQLVLQFNQIYTAFQFTVGSGDNAEVALTSFTLKSASTALAGGFEVDYSSTLPTAISRALNADSKSVTVNFPDDFKVVSGKPVTFTVLALGQTLKDLSIEFTGSVIGTRKLDLKNNNDKFIEFGPGTKYLINGLSFPNLLEATGEDIIWEQTAIGEDIAWLDDSYVLGVRDPYDLTYKGGSSETGGVISYRIVEGNPVAAAWTVVGYYDTREAAENAPSDDPDHTSYPTWINSYPSSGAGTASTSGQSVLISYFASTPSSTEKTITAEKINDEIASSTFGLGSSPECYFNLAYPENKLSDKIIESANSYVINGPGYYRIPMVMGNGVKQNALNTASYTKTSNSSYSYNGASQQRDFKNHADAVVSNPLLQKSNGTDNAYTLASAYVVWESTDGLIEVTGSDYQLVPVQNNSPFTKTEGTLNGTMEESNTTGGQDVYWLNFHVAKGEQGNAVIAVTDGSNVLWSYHIWVTNYVCRNEEADEDITVSLNPNKESFNHVENIDYTLMPLNLGWLYEGTNLKAIEYGSNTMYVKIKQTGSNKTAVMEVKRPGHHVVTKYGLGNAPYYQWGRKDPFMPTDTQGGGKNSTFTTGAFTGTGVSFGTGIQHPETFYLSDSPLGNTPWSSDLPAANAWSASSVKVALLLEQSGTKNHEIRNPIIIKTIYDPCPAGYSVPNYGVFSFRSDDMTMPFTAKYSDGWPNLSNNLQWRSGIAYGTPSWVMPLSGMADHFKVLGIKDGGYDPDVFLGYTYYTNTTVTYETRSGYAYTYPVSITVNENEGPYIFFPALGFRSYSSGVISIDNPQGYPNGARGYYWSALWYDTAQGLSFSFENFWNNNNEHSFNSKNWNHFPASDGCHIRPMQNDN